MLLLTDAVRLGMEGALLLLADFLDESAAISGKELLNLFRRDADLFGFLGLSQQLVLLLLLLEEERFGMELLNLSSFWFVPFLLVRCAFLWEEDPLVVELTRSFECTSVADVLLVVVVRLAAVCRCVLEFDNDSKESSGIVTEVEDSSSPPSLPVPSSCPPLVVSK